MTTEREMRGSGREPVQPAVRDRIIAATLVSLARYGVAKTTLEDVAKEAGCARATVYRYFGGKQQLLTTVIAHESERVLAAIDAAAEPGMSLDDALVAMATTAAHELLEHDALQFVLAHEPELILPFITFDGSDRFLASTGAALAPTFARFLPMLRREPRRAVVRPDLPRLPRSRQQLPSTMTDAREVRALSTISSPRRFAPRRPNRQGDRHMATNQEMIGREDINDLEAILSISNSDVDEVLHIVKAESDALFTWDYERSRPALIKLYEKAKTSQWNVTTDLDWSTPVDQTEVVMANQARPERLRRERGPQGHAVRVLDRRPVDPDGHRVPELDALAVPPR